MLSFALLSLLAHAEDATFTGTKTAEEAEKPESKLTAGVGGTFTVGNSESVAFNAGFDLSHKWRNNQLGFVGAAAIGFGAVDANGDGFLAKSERCLGDVANPCPPTAERYSLDARYDRFVSEKSSLYLLAGGYHDKFAGYDSRLHVQLGFARHLISDDTTHLKVELGVDLANEDYVVGVEPNSTNLVAAQLGASFDHAFNEHVGFADALTVYEPILTQPEGSGFAPHFTDIRLANVATLNAKMTDKLSLSLADTFAWRLEPVAPPEGIDEARSNVDNTLTIALVAALM